MEASAITSRRHLVRTPPWSCFRSLLVAMYWPDTRRRASALDCERNAGSCPCTRIGLLCRHCPAIRLVRTIVSTPCRDICCSKKKSWTRPEIGRESSCGGRTGAGHGSLGRLYRLAPNHFPCHGCTVVGIQVEAMTVTGLTGGGSAVTYKGARGGSGQRFLSVGTTFSGCVVVACVAAFREPGRRASTGAGWPPQGPGSPG